MFLSGHGHMRILFITSRPGKLHFFCSETSCAFTDLTFSSLNFATEAIFSVFRKTVYKESPTFIHYLHKLLTLIYCQLLSRLISITIMFRNALDSLSTCSVSVKIVSSTFCTLIALPSYIVAVFVSCFMLASKNCVLRCQQTFGAVKICPDKVFFVLPNNKHVLCLLCFIER